MPDVLFCCQGTTEPRQACVKSLPNKAKMRAGPAFTDCDRHLRIGGRHLFDMARDFDAEPMRCSPPWFVIVQTLRRRMWEQTGKFLWALRKIGAPESQEVN